MFIVYFVEEKFVHFLLDITLYFVQFPFVIIFLLYIRSKIESNLI